MALPECPIAKGKYAPLYRHLMSLKVNEWHPSFAEVEAVLGFPLPRSARIHQPWWSNQTTPGSHSHAQAWQRAGWKARNVNLVAETLLFQRNAPAAPESGSNSSVNSVADDDRDVGREAITPGETAAPPRSVADADSANTLFEQLARLNRGLTEIRDEGRRVLKRLIQSDQDLAQAAECAEQILQRNLHSATSREDARLLRCLNTALIVSYARPFSHNRASPDVRKTLPTDYFDVLSDEQHRLHEQLIQLRNRDHAHSDPQGRSTLAGIQNFGEGAVAMPASRDALAPLPRELVKRVADLIDRLRAKLADEQVHIQEALPVGERF